MLVKKIDSLKPSKFYYLGDVFRAVDTSQMTVFLYAGDNFFLGLQFYHCLTLQLLGVICVVI